MSPHQQRQGYYPSRGSMFTAMDRLSLNDTTNNYPSINNAIYNYNNPNMNASTWAAESNKSAAAAAAAQVGQKLMDGGAKLRKSNGMMNKYNSPAPLPLGFAQQQQQQPTETKYIPMPPPPPSAFVAGGKVPTPSHSHSHPSRSHSTSKSSQHPGSSPKERKLKGVVLPRETLPRFLAIAKLNTAMNRETCGLLLGREMWSGEGESSPSNDRSSKRRERTGSGGGSEYVVTTLLIPKQHGTSDMCTMDGEELVLSFTEERSLITLGWVRLFLAFFSVILK